MDHKKWYGAKTLYLVTSNTTETPANLYEERVIVLKSNSFDDAISEAEKEAANYAAEGSGLKYLRYVNVFKLFDEKIKDKTEVFSLMRESPLTPQEYIDEYYDTGNERTK
jgi:hypothetical protein